MPSIAIDYSGLDNDLRNEKYFIIFNNGSRNLIIEDFTSSCECTSVGLKKNQIIEPHDSIKVSLKISEVQDSDNAVFITIKTNAKPRLTSFHFKP